MKRIIVILLVVALVAGGGFAWYYFQGPCGVNLVNTSLDELNDQIEKFNDAYSVASATARISLSGPINELQSIRRETGDMEVPQCLKTTKELIEGGMQSYIDGFIAFSAQEKDADVTLHFVNGDDQFSVAFGEMDTIAECAPFCKEDPYRVIP